MKRDRCSSIPGSVGDRPGATGEEDAKKRKKRFSPITGLIAIAGWTILLSGGHAMAADGLKTMPSEYGAKETVDRLEAEIKAKGMTVFARVDHAAGAEAEGLPLRPTELLIFGSAKAGTPLMEKNQAIGIDLPLKALVYEDADGKVWLSFNEPAWLVHRHGLGPEVDPITIAMTRALYAVATTATKVPGTSATIRRRS